MQTMKIQYLILFTVLSACGAKHSGTQYGKTTVSDLIAEKGKPLEEKDIPVSDGKVFVYAENEKYQIAEGIVTHGFKDPKGDEKLVLFWKHKFKNCSVKNRALSSTKVHAQSEHQLRCDAQGLTVIYTEGSPYVSRIIEHEKK